MERSMTMNEQICEEYALLTSLNSCDGLQYVDDQISAHSKHLKTLVKAFAQHPGHRDMIEGFIDYAIMQLETLKKIKDFIRNNNKSNKTETMEANVFHYSEEDFFNNKNDLSDAYSALHFATNLDGSQRESISHCLSLLNDFLNALHDGKTIKYETE